MEAGEYVFNPRMATHVVHLPSGDEEADSPFMELESNGKEANVDMGNQEDFIGTDLPTCGLYLIGEPDTIVEMVLKHYDVKCEEAGLMAVSL